MQPVGELDEDHAEVLGHRDHHLADVLRLLLLVRAQRDAAQLGHAVDQAGDLGTELLLHRLRRERRVFDRVMEKGRRERFGVELEIGQDGRHLHRVVHVLLA